MPESRSHKRIKNKMAGPKGKTEVKLPSGRRMDALSKNRVGTEVERQGPKSIPIAVSRLKEATKSKVSSGSKLVVPNKDLQAARKEMRRQGVRGRVQNLGNSKAFYVKPARPKPKRDSSRRSTKR